jgi:hypothetical protein
MVIVDAAAKDFCGSPMRFSGPASGVLLTFG